MIPRWLGPALALLLFFSILALADDEISFKWSGDLRLRAQLEKAGDNEARWSEKIRARFGTLITINPEINLEFRLATAKSNRSTNQTLGDSQEPGARRRSIGLDLAYAQWMPLDFLKLYVGRVPQLHYRPPGSQLILDEDITLEGVGATSDYTFRENWKVFGGTGSAVIRENYDSYYSEDVTDNVINWGQLGIEFKSEKLKAIVGAGFYNFVGVKGSNFTSLVGGGTANGNTESSPGVIQYAYVPTEAFAELTYKMERCHPGAFVHRIHNDEAPSNNMALWTGLSLECGAVDSQIAYSRVEQDAVLGLFTHSDFAGGTTDSEGWVGNVRWKFAKNMNLKVSQFINTTNLIGVSKEYRRTHFDISASF